MQSQMVHSIGRNLLSRVIAKYPLKGFANNSSTNQLWAIQQVHEGKRLISFRSLQLSPASDKKTKPWRESGSLIMTAPMNNSPPFSFGHLMIERSKGSLLAGGTVFPGGVLSPVDSSPHWIDLFKAVNVDLKTVQFLGESANIPDIYISDNNNELPFPKAVVLRLTTIRETFEEVGALICRRNCESSNLGGGHMYEYDQLSDRKVVHEWQKKIRKNPQEFLNLCTELKCVPDLSALHEWSNWLSILKPKTRFDTVFYLTVLPTMLRVAYDTHEVASAQEYKEGKVKLMPPQLCELSRLESAKTFADFESKIEIRREKGIERFFPVVQQATNGTIYVLPGDDMYPSTVDFVNSTKPVKADATVEQQRSSAKNLHRVELTKNGMYKSVVNVARYNGHSY